MNKSKHTYQQAFALNVAYSGLIKNMNPGTHTVNFSQATQQLKPSYIRTILTAAQAPEVISLAGGLPDAALFPVAEFRESAVAVLAQANTLQYSETAGLLGLRQYISQQYGCAESELLITNGAQQGLDLVSRLLLNPGDQVLVESPSYLGALQIFTLAQSRILSVEQLPLGPNIELIEHQFRQHAIKVFYCVPDFHNPTGIQWSLAQRQAVLSLAEKYKVTIIEDSPYKNLSFADAQYKQTQPIPTLYELNPEQVIHLGSFSKVCAPGFRLGYTLASPHYINGLCKIKQATDLHSSTFNQAILLHWLQSFSMTTHIQKLTYAYQQRLECLTSELENHLSHPIRFQTPKGGMFLWVELKEINGDQLAEAALKLGVAVVPGSVFYPEEFQRSSFLRLNFTNVCEQEIKIAVERLGQALSAVS